MPFNLQVPDLVPQIIVNAGNRLDDQISQAMAMSDQMRRQHEYATGLSMGLSADPAGSIADVIARLGVRSDGGAARDLSPDQLSGLLQGWQAGQQNRLAQQKSELESDQLGFMPTPADFDRAHGAGYELVPTGHGRYRAVSKGAGSGSNTPDFTPTPDQVAQGEKVGLVWFPTSRGQGRWIRKDGSEPGSQPPAPKASRAFPTDSLELLDKDVRAISGSPLSTFINGTNHRIVGDKFMVDGGGGIGTAQMPVPMYERFRDRYNSITAGPSQPASVLPGTSGATNSGPTGASGGIDASAALSQARAKIQAGADPNLVRQRLQQLGVDPNGL